MNTKNCQEASEPDVSPPPVKRPSKFLRFGLRTLLILLVVSAFVINQMRRAKLQRDGVARLTESKVQIIYKHELNDEFDFEATDWKPFKVSDADQSRVRKKLRSWLGSEHVDRVSYVSMFEKQLSKRLDDDAWLALRSLNEVRPLDGLAVEVSSTNNVDAVARFSRLKFLRLNSYFRGSLASLNQLQNVEHFELAIRQPEVEWIGAMPNLKTLKVRKILSAPAFSIDLGFLANLQQVERLELRALALTNEDSINQLSNLRHLSLRFTETSDTSWIPKLEILETLDLSDSLIRKPKIDNKNLRELNLSNSPISDLSAIATNQTLKIINLKKTLVDQKQIDELKQRLNTAKAECEILQGGVWVNENEVEDQGRRKTSMRIPPTSLPTTTIEDLMKGT